MTATPDRPSAESYRRAGLGKQAIRLLKDTAADQQRILGPSIQTPSID
jgi:hypothetical protein